jgi:hypothetical protein
MWLQAEANQYQLILVHNVDAKIAFGDPKVIMEDHGHALWIEAGEHQGARQVS